MATPSITLMSTNLVVQAEKSTWCVSVSVNTEINLRIRLYLTQTSGILVQLVTIQCERLLRYINPYVLTSYLITYFNIWVKFEGQRRKLFFGYDCSRWTEKWNRSREKPFTEQCEKCRLSWHCVDFIGAWRRYALYSVLLLWLVVVEFFVLKWSVRPRVRVFQFLVNTWNFWSTIFRSSLSSG